MRHPPSLRATRIPPPHFRHGRVRLCALTAIVGDHRTPSTGMQSSAACPRSPPLAADADPVKPAPLPAGEPPPALCLPLLLLYLRRAPLDPPASHRPLPLALHVLLSHEAAELRETNDDVSTPRVPACVAPEAAPCADSTVSRSMQAGPPPGESLSEAPLPPYRQFPVGIRYRSVRPFANATVVRSPRTPRTCTLQLAAARLEHTDTRHAPQL